MKIKIIFLIIYLIIIISTPVYGAEDIIENQLEAIDISSVINEGKKYTKDVFPEVDIDIILRDVISGNLDNKTIFIRILSLFGEELVNSITLIGSILVIIVIHSILKNIGENLGNENVSKIAYYIEYIVIVTLITANFSQIIISVKETINNLTGFMNTLLPILIALIAATGQVATVTVLQPVILFSVVIIGNIITTVILPIITVSTALDIISNLSDKVQVGKLAKFLKTSIVWVLGFTITIFVGVLSLEGTLTSSIDGVTIKGIKTATSTFIPVVGKALGDSVDTVLGATSLIKNSLGIVGVIIIIGICITPIIKLTILSTLYSLSAAISEPLADKKIVKIISQIGGTFKILLGVMFFITVLLIIGIAIILKISNASIMYR